MRTARTLLMVFCLIVLATFPCLAQEAEAPPADDVDQAGEAAPVDDEAPAEEAQAEGGEAADAEALLLRFNYEEGETLTYETEVDGVGSVHVMGQAQALDMTGKMLVKMTVEEIDEEGNYAILTDVDIDELTVTMAGSPVPPPTQAIQMRTKMSPRGEILDMEMTQAVNKPKSESPWNSQMAKMLTGGFDLNRMIVGQKIAAFPEETVKPGDEWTGNAPRVELQGQTAPLEITTTYDGNIEIDGTPCARLDSSTCMQPGALGELATMLSMQGSTTTNTRTWFDFEAGRMVASMEQTQVNMQVSLPAEMTGAQGPAAVFLEMFVDTQSKLLPSGEEEQ